MNDKRKIYIMKNAYSPYRTESLVYLALDFFALAMIALTVSVSYAFGITGSDLYKLAILLMSCHMIVSCSVFHGTTILSFLEIKKQKWKRQRLTIKRVINVPSFSGGRFDDNPISNLYPSKMRVCRFWLICRNEKGRLVILRCVMSSKKVTVLNNQVCNSEKTCCDISYGPYTKVVFYYHSADEWADLLNHMF